MGYNNIVFHDANKKQCSWVIVIISAPEYLSSNFINTSFHDVDLCRNVNFLNIQIENLPFGTESGGDIKILSPETDLDCADTNAHLFSFSHQDSE